jgi:hypothetical protein
MATCREVMYYTRTIDGETWHYFGLEPRLKESELTRESADSEFGKERELSSAASGER